MTDEREKLFRDQFAANLVKQRKAKGLSQKQLGVLCGFNEKSAENIVQRWEYRTSLPNTYYIRLLADALGCTADGLIPVIPN